MQFTKSLVACCLTLAAMASPIEQSGSDLADRAASADGLVEVPGFSERRDDRLFRRNTKCTIAAHSGNVNCRSSTNTKSDNIVTTLPPGSTHEFKCAQKGECVTVGGKTNCYWDKVDRSFAKDCWVSAYYTSSECTPAALGTGCD